MNLLEETSVQHFEEHHACPRVYCLLHCGTVALVHANACTCSCLPRAMCAHLVGHRGGHTPSVAAQGIQGVIIHMQPWSTLGCGVVAGSDASPMEMAVEFLHVIVARLQSSCCKLPPMCIGAVYTSVQEGAVCIDASRRQSFLHLLPLNCCLQLIKVVLLFLPLSLLFGVLLLCCTTASLADSSRLQSLNMSLLRCCWMRCTT
mmetsp:Transcript_30115/g.78141  ORF Transcript_30115/g.78141 Transcript_30115/m.78141 type:complete len:203 (+) Transcript_30115:2024-2632(+)